MKKSLLALAVLGAFAGAASAQTAVTIYGSFDGGIRHLTNVDAAGNSTLKMSNAGNYNNNRFGFKGVEDLGGGLNAHFALEGGFNNGTGVGNAGLFDRTAIVGLGGAWGAVDLGRQYSVNFKTIGAYDPFGYKYTGIDPLATQGGFRTVTDAGLTRLNNDIQYTGAFGPVTVRAEYALGEQAGSTTAGATEAIGAGYAAGPFSVGAAYTAGKRGLTATTATNDMKNWTAGGAFNSGKFGVAIGYANNKQDLAVAGAQTTTKDWWVGGHFDVSPAATLTAGYFETKGISLLNATGALANVALGGNADDAKRKLAIIGATYALSKRTNFYADIDNARFTNLANQASQTGISAGINHLF